MFTTYLSRFVMAAGVIIFITSIALVATYKKQTIQMAEQKPTPIPIAQSQPIASPSSATSSATTEKVSFTLEGPLRCSYSQKGSTVQMVVKNNNISIVQKENGGQNNFLLKGDCLYTWRESSGSKYCGMSQYISLYNTFAGLGIVDINSITSIFSQAGKKVTGDQENLIKQVVATCKPASVLDSSFALPKGVSFP